MSKNGESNLKKSILEEIVWPNLISSNDHEYINNEVERLAKDGNIDEKNSSGYTLLMLAIKNHKFNLYKALLKHNADVKLVSNYGHNILHYLYDIKDEEILRLSIEKCVETGFINKRDCEGYTLLMRALKNKNFWLANILLEYDVDVTVVSIHNEYILNLIFPINDEEILNSTLKKCKEAGIIDYKDDTNFTLLMQSLFNNKEHFLKLCLIMVLMLHLPLMVDIVPYIGPIKQGMKMF